MIRCSRDYRVKSMLKRLAACKIATVESFNTFCLNAFIVIVVTSAFVLTAQWWVSTYCLQGPGHGCALALPITRYWWIVMLLGFVFSLIAAIVNWLYRLIYSAR